MSLETRLKRLEQRGNGGSCPYAGQVRAILSHEAGQPEPEIGPEDLCPWCGEAPVLHVVEYVVEAGTKP
jgi:hypothetical protein